MINYIIVALNTRIVKKYHVMKALDSNSMPKFENTSHVHFSDLATRYIFQPFNPFLRNVTHCCKRP